VPTSIEDLLGDRRFRLRLVVGAGSPALTEELGWVHSSDLPDPTPWLEPGQLLLTDGDQLRPGVAAEFVGGYVRALIDGGILGLGLATGIIHDEVPAELIAQCRRQGLVLIEVADRTPFMAIIRHVADGIALDNRARLEWSMTAQRAIARAATRPDGLAEILRELENRLGCWVALFDGLGEQVRASVRHTMPEAVAAEVGDAVTHMLARGTRAGGRISVADDQVTLQSLGQGGRLRGVLAVGTSAPLDPAGDDLVASVIALASIALEQNQALAAAQRGLRTGLLELLLAGEVDVAQRTARPIWGALPAEPVRLALTAATDAPEALLTELELLADRHPGRLFVARRGGDLVVIVPGSEGADALEAALARHRVVTGLSAPAPWRALARALDESRRALARADAERPSVRFDALAGDGVLGLLEQAGAADVARRVLEPLRDSGRPDAELLLVSAATWLDRNGAWDPAARALGVHRHTLRSRIALVETALGIDLERFAHRAELWSALEFGGVEPVR